MCLAVLIVCRKGILDPKKPANRHTGYPGQAMQFLAAGQKHSNLLSLKKKDRIQKNLEKIQIFLLRRRELEEIKKQNRSF
jgi:hypothetical protein